MSTESNQPLELKTTFDRIVEYIDKEECVLIIGPELIVRDGNKSFYEVLSDHLHKFNRSYNDESENKLICFNDDEFFCFGDEKEKMLTIYEIQRFYKNFKPGEIYDKISDIPFSLIMSVSPDTLLRNIFDKKGFKYRFSHYSKERNPEPVGKPTKSLPLIYNLLGQIEDDGSLVFTYNDLFEYLFKILKEHELPVSLKEALYKAKMFLFLGFKYEKWYFRLLLRMLELHKNKFVHTGLRDRELSNTVKNFYSYEFKVWFLDLCSEQIVNRIHDNFREKAKLRLKLPDIYISYAREQESEEILKSLTLSLDGEGMNYIIDKTDLRFKGNIISFMEKLGRGDMIILIISKKYLESEYCLFEVNQIIENGSFFERIFPIVLDSANIYNEEICANYINYWNGKIKKLNEAVSNTEDNLMISRLNKQIIEFKKCKDSFYKLSEEVSKMNCLEPETHRNTNFSSIISSVKNTINSKVD